MKVISAPKAIRNLIKSLFPAAIIFFFALPAYSQGEDLVNGNLIQFNDNGFWCWYQDERMVVDADSNKLILGSDASGSGTGGSARNGNVESVIYDLNTGLSERTSLLKTGCDDHNTPAFIIRPDGKYLTMYAQHYDLYNSRYQIYNESGWSGEYRFDWTTIPGGTDYTIAYSNLYYLAEEGRMYNFARANHRSPNFIYSDDQGDNWYFGAQLSTNNTHSYNKGYYKYWGNGTDRIDFICTEEHPRDGKTSMYHAYIQGEKVFRTDGVLADVDLYSDAYIPSFEDFTLIFADSTVIDGKAMRKVWNADLVRYANGEIAAILTARINNATNGGDFGINPDHAFIYCRYNQSEWSYTYLGQAGKKMYGSEADYTGLGALDPDDPNTIYISTHVDPRDDQDITYREIFKGITEDDGASWTWIPLTWNSTVHNFRPIVPKWNEQNTALLWCRGMYSAAQNFNAVIVGLLETEGFVSQPMSYFDATPSNTSNADGSPLALPAPEPSEGPDDDLWHARTGFGNGDTVFTASETGDAENAPMIRTRVTVPAGDRFDVWVNFWADPSADWRIKAGLSENDLHFFRQMACKQVEAGDHSDTLVLIEGNARLYQAYLGKVDVSSGDTFYVFIDDESIETGSTSNRSTSARTVYDGISYSLVRSLEVSQGNMEFASAASDSAVNLTANVEWTIESAAGWVTPSPASGSGNQSIAVDLTENTGDSSRTTSLTISSDGMPSKTVTLIQLAASQSLMLSSAALEMNGNEGSASEFIITSNTSWTVTSSEAWLEASPSSGINIDTIRVRAHANAEFSTSRNATLTVSGSGVADQTVNVTQHPQDLFYVIPLILEVDRDENSTAAFEIMSNVPWNAVSSDPSWLSLSAATGDSSLTITVTATENPEHETRSAVVTVSAGGFSDKMVTVTQAASITSSPVQYFGSGKVYPNPAGDKIFIEIASRNAWISLYNASGVKLVTVTTNELKSEMDLSAYPPGLYILQVVTGEQTFIEKIVKE